MAEQVIDPAKLILSIKDQEKLIQGHRQTYEEPTAEGLRIINRNLWSGPEPGGPHGDPRDTNLLPFKPITKYNLQDFIAFCGPVQGINDNTKYTERIGASILQVTYAYLRQICLFVNSHSPVRNLRDDYLAMAYLPHDFWNPPTDPPSEKYIEDRAKFIRTTARLPPQRLKALTHLFIHLTPYPTKLIIKPNSAMMVITPRAATIGYFDQLDSPDKHHLIGDLLSVISRVDTDRSGTWLELWGLDPTSKEYDFFMWRKAMVIAIDLYSGYFSNVIDSQYKPRVKRIFGHRSYKEGYKPKWIDNVRQRRSGSPWLHFLEKIYRRLLPRELAQWNAGNVWRGLDEEKLEEKARERMRDPRRSGRYYGMPEGAELGELGKKMKGKRVRNLRMWLEDRDYDNGKSVTRYHNPDEPVGWNIGGNY